MYAKLFERITESSLMEEPLETRYCFILLLAIANPRGQVIGTDVAIARRINMPLKDFKAAIQRLKQPDPDSNSQEEDGARVTHSKGERGYLIVNYAKYRSIRDESDRRDYMRDYMKEYRRKQRKPALAPSEEEADGDGETDADNPRPTSSGSKGPIRGEECEECPKGGDWIGFSERLKRPCDCVRGRKRAADFARAVAMDAPKTARNERGGSESIGEVLKRIR